MLASRRAWAARSYYRRQEYSLHHHTGPDGQGSKSARSCGRCSPKPASKPGDHVIAYCHIGIQAPPWVFAARTLGIDAKLYDGFVPGLGQTRAAGRNRKQLINPVSRVEVRLPYSMVTLMRRLR